MLYYKATKRPSPYQRTAFLLYYLYVSLQESELLPWFRGFGLV